MWLRSLSTHLQYVNGFKRILYIHSDHIVTIKNSHNVIMIIMEANMIIDISNSINNNNNIIHIS